MGLITRDYNLLARIIDKLKENFTRHIVEKYPDVFGGTPGTLLAKGHLVTKPDAKLQLENTLANL